MFELLLHGHDDTPTDDARVILGGFERDIYKHISAYINDTVLI